VSGGGGWIEGTMISCGIEISIAGGVAETEDLAGSYPYPSYKSCGRVSLF